MNLRRGPGAALALLAFACGCPSSAPTEHGPIAQVGDRLIPAQDLIVVLHGMAEQGELPRGGGFAVLCERVLDARIVEEVLLQEAAQRGSRALDAAVQAEVAQRLGEPPNLAVLDSAVALHGSKQKWVEVVARRMTLTATEQALRAELAEGTSVTPEQVQAAIPRYQERLMRPARIRARQFFDEDPETVRALHQRLVAGESFETLADEAGYESAGDLGFMSEEAAPSLLVQACAELSPGEYTAVLRSPLGYHVFQLVARAPAGMMPPERVAELVQEWLVAEAAESRLRAWLASRTQEMGLTVHEDVLDALRCCREGVPYLAPKKEKS